MQVPSNLFLNKIGKPAIYLPTCMIIWGTISAATAACQSYGGLIACRFMLGFVEAAYFVSVAMPSVDCSNVSIIAGMSVLPVVLVHQERAWISNCDPLLWSLDQWCIFRPNRCRYHSPYEWHKGFVGLAMAFYYRGSNYYCYRFCSLLHLTQFPANNFSGCRFYRYLFISLTR